MADLMEGRRRTRWWTCWSAEGGPDGGRMEGQLTLTVGLVAGGEDGGRKVG